MAQVFKSLALIASSTDTIEVSNATIKRSRWCCLTAKWRRAADKHRAYFKSNIAESPQVFRRSSKSQHTVTPDQGLTIKQKSFILDKQVCS
jgi:hypothetical protein